MKILEWLFGAAIVVGIAYVMRCATDGTSLAVFGAATAWMSCDWWPW